MLTTHHLSSSLGDWSSWMSHKHMSKMGLHRPPPRPASPSGSPCWCMPPLTTLPPEAENGHQLRAVGLISYFLLVCGSDHSVSKRSLELAPSSQALLPCDRIPIFFLNKWVVILNTAPPAPSCISGLPQPSGRNKNSLEHNFSLTRLHIS